MLWLLPCSTSTTAVFFPLVLWGCAGMWGCAVTDLPAGALTLVLVVCAWRALAALEGTGYKLKCVLPSDGHHISLGVTSPPALCQLSPLLKFALFWDQGEMLELAPPGFPCSAGAKCVCREWAVLSWASCRRGVACSPAPVCGVDVATGGVRDVVGGGFGSLLCCTWVGGG